MDNALSRSFQPQRRNALMELLQAASNAVAGNVSGPVDLIAMGLRKAGVPVPEDAFLSSQWLAERGLTRDVPMGPARIAGETLGMAGPAVLAAKAPQVASALNQGAANLAAPRTLNPQTGAIVWHGSPHKFDRFDSSKIGTGEGAQAYGHGLYLAESPQVAGSYSGKLSSELTYNGRAMQRESGRNSRDSAAWALYLADGDKAAAKASGLAKPELIDALDPAKLKPGGQLYKVDLPDEQIARMLDWDKPLSQQAPGVADALRGLAVDATTRKMLADDTRASAAYKLLGLDLSSADEAYQGSREVANALRQRGIPGLRYLDGGSRGGGQGTSNFVVFPGEENALRILERNGRPL